MKKIICIYIYICLFPFISFSQEEPKNWELTGYIKDLQSLINLREPLPFINQSLLQENLLHNRLNFKWYPSDSWTLKVDARNRFFWGDLTRLQTIPNDLLFREGLEVLNDWIDLSIERGNGDKGIGYQLMLDRAYLEFTSEKLEVRAGRQRINWGINTFWNPNDVFNTFNFTDFDYEERPGSDALRVKYYTGFASSLEVAVKGFDKFEEAVMAGLWKFNFSNYDFQILAGLVQEDIVLGGGWAGNLKNVGFKGEFSYFISDEENAFAASLGVDYMFGNSLFLSAGTLFNSLGETIGSEEIFSFQPSAKNLYPYKFTLFIQTTYPLTPLLNGGLALLYSPSDIHAVFLNPFITYSLGDNLDLQLLGQLSFNKIEDEGYKSPIQLIFIRLKHSF